MVRTSVSELVLADSAVILEDVLGLFALFVALPALELYLLLSIGAQIGASSTLLLILFTGVVGASLVKQQGFSVFMRIQAESAQGRIPAIELIEGLVLVVAGAFLLTPGLITDTLGFLALVPPLRHRAALAVAERMVKSGHGAAVRFQFGGIHPGVHRTQPPGYHQGPRPPRAGPVIDVEGRTVRTEGKPERPK